MPNGLPLVTRTAIFKATGFVDVTKLGLAIPLTHVPTKWSMQVTGLDAAGKVVTAPTAWNVTLLGSQDGLGYDSDAAALLTHVNGTNGNGDSVDTGANFKVRRWVKIHCVSLTISPADHILVTVTGE